MNAHGHSTTSLEASSLDIDPRAAIRPERFGALGYHYDTRRLVFLRDPDLVTVVAALASHQTVAATLDACDVGPERRGAFVAAIGQLLTAGVLRERSH